MGKLLISDHAFPQPACVFIFDDVHLNEMLHAQSFFGKGFNPTAQNSLAWVVTNTSRFEYITPVLHLHWLPLSHRIEFKLSTMAFKIRSTGNPVYLSSSSSWSLINDYASSRHSAHLLFYRWSGHRAGRPCVNVAYVGLHATPVWNSVPLAVRSLDSVGQFQSNL